MTAFKQTQVAGKKYDLPEQEIHVKKLIQQGIRVKSQINELQSKLDNIRSELTEIAEQRRGDNKTSVSLKAISGESATITFRESLEVDQRVNEIAHKLGSLFDRFFLCEQKFKGTKDLKAFITGNVSYGIEDQDDLIETIKPYITKKIIKPSIRFTQG